MDLVFFYGALAAYLAGTLLYLIHLVTRRSGPGRLATAATLAGLVAHTLAQAVRIWLLGRPPLGSSFESLSVFAWVLVLIYLVLEFRYHNRIFGAFVLPIVLLAGSTAAALPDRVGALRPAWRGAGLWLHVSLAVVGNAAFALTFCLGLMYLIQERQLKSKSPRPIAYRLPSLELLDTLSYRALFVGFPLMTLAIITGSLWAAHAWGSYWAWDPKQTWSLITWVIYAGLVHARLSAGWRGRKAALLAIIGFSAVLITFVGVNLFTGGMHAF